MPLKISEDLGYVADHEDSHLPEWRPRKHYRHRRTSRDRRKASLDSSSDSEQASQESGIALSRCSSPCSDCCKGCHRPVDRCRCRLKRRGNKSQYVLWKRDLGRSFEVQCNSVELPEAISGNFTPSLWQSQEQQRLKRMLNFNHPPQYQPPHVPLHYPGYVRYIPIAAPCYVRWQMNQYGILQPVGWYQLFPNQHTYQIVYPVQQSVNQQFCQCSHFTHI